MTDNEQRKNPYQTRTAAQRRAERRARAQQSVTELTGYDPYGRDRTTKQKQQEKQREARAKQTALVSQDQIAAMLANPTRIVTEAQLREEYTYVVTDIRNMFLLAVGLIGLLIVLALVLPR